MGTDDLFWKRKHSIIRRKSGKKGKPFPTFLIVCEGEKTEPNYFQSFKNKIKSIELIIIGCGMNTKSLVKHAIELIRIGKTDGIKYDSVWCVFDKDDNSLEQFNAALKMAKVKKINVAYSNQAFELWYLLHFQYIDTAILRQEYENRLTKFLKSKYLKNRMDMYDKLESFMDDAIRNAEKLLSQYPSLNPGENNPSTTVHKLVEELKKYLLS